MPGSFRGNCATDVVTYITTTALVLGVSLLIVGCHNAKGLHSPQDSPAVHRSPFAADRSGVPTSGRCGAFPRVAVAAQSSEIDCVGLIDNTLNFPRGVLAWGNDILVVDKGSNLHQRAAGEYAGRVLRYTPTERGFIRSTLLSGLDNPNSLSRGQHVADHDQVYISSPDAILRLTPDAENPTAQLETVVRGLGLRGWHYLSAVYATPDYLYVTVPSTTDHCERPASRGPEAWLRYPCPEVAATTPAELATASIRRYRIGPGGAIADNFRVIAQGLRDALAVVLTPDGKHLLVADNGWDNIVIGSDQLESARLPLDELNLLPLTHRRSTQEPPPHFGWPYCYQRGSKQVAVTPGYEHALSDCNGYTAAQHVLPAHSAPLALLYHNNRLFLNLHGFAPGGRSTVALQVDHNGIPEGKQHTFVDWDYRHVLGYLGGRPLGLAGYGRDLLVTDDWNQSLLLVRLQ